MGCQRCHFESSLLYSASCCVKSLLSSNSWHFLWTFNSFWNNRSSLVYCEAVNTLALQARQAMMCLSLLLIGNPYKLKGGAGRPRGYSTGQCTYVKGGNGRDGRCKFTKAPLITHTSQWGSKLFWNGIIVVKALNI